MNTPNAISLADRVQYHHAGHHASKDRVDPVEMRLGGMGNEILAAAGIGPRQRHPDPAGVVSHRIDLVAQHEPRPRSSPSVPPGISVLDHEVGHDAMPPGAVEEPPLHESDERRHG